MKETKNQIDVPDPRWTGLRSVLGAGVVVDREDAIDKALMVGTLDAVWLSGQDASARERWRWSDGVVSHRPVNGREAVMRPC